MKKLIVLLFLVPATLGAESIPALLTKGESNLALGNLATADKAFRDALREALKARDRRNEAAARNGIARVFPGNRWEALGHLQLALAIHRDLKDAKGEASDLARMGEIKLVHGFRKDAIASLTEAAALQERIGLVEERAATLENLGVALQSTGAYEEAATHLATAVELQRRASVAPFELVRAEVRLATLQTLLGLDESAVEHLQAAKESIRRFRARFPAKKWNALRAAWVKHGRNFNKSMGPMAADFGELMADGAMPMPTEDVELLDLIAPALERLGQGQELPDDAPKFPSLGATGSSEASTLSRRMTAGGFVAMTNHVIRWMLQQMEDIRKDLRREFAGTDIVLMESIAATQPCEMEIESRLQHILRLTGNDDEAKASNELAWKLFDKQSEDYAGLFDGISASDVADERRVARKLGLAIPPVYTNPCDGVLSAAKDTLWDADLAAARGNVEEAIRDYSTAASSSPALRVTALTRIASLRDRKGNGPAALDAYEQAIEAVEQMQGRLRLDELVMSWAGQQAPLYSRAIVLSLERKQPEAAFAYAERARARAFLNQIGNRRLPAAVNPALAAELQDVRGRLIALEAPQAPMAIPMPMPPPMPMAMPNMQGAGGDPRALEREALQKRYAELLGRLAQSNPAYLSLVQVEPLNLAKLQREVLPAGTTLIEYFVLDDRTIAWVIDRGSLHAIELKISADELNGRVDVFRTLVKNARPEWSGAAEELYATLVAPLKQHIRNPNLIIIPHASLHFLPFAALRNRQGARHLIEDYTITIAPSASALRFMKAAGKQSSSMLAFGDPDRTLPHAEAEAIAVAKSFKATAYVGKDATEKRLRSESARAGFVHIAAHAMYDPLRPLFSRIALAPAGDDEATDGKLHVYEIPDLDLSSARLAVLSACETALGPRSNGDDLVALTRAFLAAGAPAVMTTLWPVDDASTAELMVSFYERARKGSPLPKALQEAQVAMLARRDARDWASFVLAGDGK